MENLKEFKILVVDDSPELLDITSRTLRKANYAVLTASTGNECNKIIESEKPDLVLLDIVLPDANGLDLCRAIKKNPLLSSTYVILFSSIKINTDDISESLESGADAYITRPIENRELLARVKSAFRIVIAENKIKQNNSLLEACINSSDDIGILALDTNYNYLVFNNKHRIFMLQEFDIQISIDLNFLECINIPSRMEHYKYFIDLSLKGESYIHIDLEEDKNHKFFQTSYNPIFNENREVIGATAFSLDITSLKTSERNLLKKIEELEVFNKLAVGRELTMIDLKKEVNQLLINSGGKEKYRIVH